MWESYQNEEKEYVADSRHDERLSGLPSLKGNEKQHECQKVPKGAMNGTTHVGENATGLQYRRCKWRCGYYRAGNEDPKGQYQRV